MDKEKEITNNLIQVGRELLTAERKCLSCFEAFLNAMENSNYGTTTKSNTPAKNNSAVQSKAVNKPASCTKEDVRKALSALANAGCRNDVIDLLNRYKAKTLSDVDPLDYPAIIEQANTIASGAGITKSETSKPDNK